jgi:hypothetical protein
MEIKGEEKYLAELDIALKNALNLIKKLSTECGNTKLNNYKNTIKDIRRDVQDRIIDIS